MFRAMLAINFNDADDDVHFWLTQTTPRGVLGRDTFVRDSPGCALFQTARRFRTEKEAQEFVLDGVRESSQADRDNKDGPSVLAGGLFFPKEGRASR